MSLYDVWMLWVEMMIVVFDIFDMHQLTALLEYLMVITAQTSKVLLDYQLTYALYSVWFTLKVYQGQVCLLCEV